jgi:hypothetical protein
VICEKFPQKRFEKSTKNAKNSRKLIILKPFFLPRCNTQGCNFYAKVSPKNAHNHPKMLKICLPIYMSPTDNNKNWFEVAILDKGVFINYLIIFVGVGGGSTEFCDAL